MDLVKSFICDGACPNWRIVTFSTTTAGAVRTTRAAGTLGIVQDRGGANGERCDVKMIGFGQVELAEALAYGAAIQAHTDDTGRAQVNTDIEFRVGRLLKGGDAGDIVPVLICPN